MPRKMRCVSRYLAISCSVVLALWVSACAPLGGERTRATAFGTAIDTTVDSPVARYYLEQYLQDTHSDPALSGVIAGLHAKWGSRIPTREELRDVAQTQSVDFAALLLVRQLLQDPCNRQINADFAALLGQATPAPLDTASFLVLFMPGWDYAENGAVTGADFAQPQKLVSALGVENHLVALPPTGSVEANATMLAQAVAHHARAGKRILIAGASSSGPAIHLALSELLAPQDVAAVHAWLNLGGILQGSPLVDFLQEAPQRWLFDAVVWFKGWDPQAIRSMSAHTSRARFARLHLPQHVLVVNYLGVPLSGQLSPYSRDKYPLLKSDGPNDGLTLLTDAIAPHSLTIVALGSDHFFAEDPQINAKTVALLRLIVAYLRQKPGQCKVPTMQPFAQAPRAAPRTAP